MASRAQSVNFDGDDVHTLEPLVPRDPICERVRKTLHLFVGRGRRYSVDELSLGAGVPKRCIQAAMAPINDENFRPLTLSNLASITKFLGAPFASAILELSDLGAFELSGQPPLPHVLCSAAPPQDVEQERKRLIRRLAELEGLE